jgi:hypothetical protein
LKGTGKALPLDRIWHEEDCKWTNTEWKYVRKICNCRNVVECWLIYLVQGVILGRLNQEELVLIGLAYYYQGKDIVFRFIIEYSSLMDFGPLGIFI